MLLGSMNEIDHKLSWYCNQSLNVIVVFEDNNIFDDFLEYFIDWSRPFIRIRETLFSILQKKDILIALNVSTVHPH